MQWVILIVIGIGWLIIKAFEGASDTAASYKKKQDFKREKDEKYKDRVIDTSKDLFERNRDIISKFEDKISSSSYRYYYLENETRDCINEICIAEGRSDIQPSYKYLSNWRTSAPKEWVELSQKIEKVFSDRQKALREVDTKISSTQSKLNALKSKRQNPTDIQKVSKRVGKGSLAIEDIAKILTPDATPWIEKEAEIIGFNGTYKEFPRFESEVKSSAVKQLNQEISNFNKELELDVEGHQKNREFFQKLLEGYKDAQKESVIQRLDYILNSLAFPASIPKIWEIDFDTEQSIALVEVQLPDVVHSQVFKSVALKSGTVQKPLNQKETKDLVPSFHPAIMLRTAFEIFRNDNLDVIKLLVLNGWVEFDDPATGLNTKTYTSSLVVEKSQVKDLNLTKLDPVAAFLNLKGKSAGKLIDIIPVTPMMSLNKKDKRFIETKEVLNQLDTQTNLASMDWQDFESLIAELFQKEFAKEGVEVKVTQASRDRGVDAVIFDPDPIKGGKYIVQAKRYTNTVDVSAVRDLCAVVKKEGASKGILVTTSAYGSDAYAFAQNEPVTLINGAELLGLLEKHNYKFRINLQEARKMMAAQTTRK